MTYFIYIIASLLSEIQHFFSNIGNSPYLDFIKMFIGCVAWIGGLVLFVKWNEKKKTKEAVAA